MKAARPTWERMKGGMAAKRRKNCGGWGGLPKRARKQDLLQQQMGCYKPSSILGRGKEKEKPWQGS